MDERTKKRVKFLVDAAYIAVIALLVFFAFKFVSKWILPFLLAFCLVSALHPAISGIVRRIGIKREIVSVAVIVLIYALICALLTFAVWQIIVTIRYALELLPSYYEGAIKPTMNALSHSLTAFVAGLPEQWQETAAGLQFDLISSMQHSLFNISQWLLNSVSKLSGGLPSFMIGTLFTIMLSFFISLHYNKVLSFIKTQLPPRARKAVGEIRTIFFETVVKYIRAALTLMCVTFAELSIGLLVLGRRNAIAVAAGIAIFDALPFFGTGAIVLPWALIELIQGNYPLAAGLAILYGIVVFVRNIIEPKIVGDKLGLNPVVSLVAIYLGYRIFGVLGMIVMPITTQISLELHRRGTIRLFKEETANENSGTI